ncbi:RraA family protein [Salisediminibacterium selenitireducens]|uniref:Putative 4-hydroxy-4-methyl-2-oxoglutarate aldolase n=1 Tax=Bacillus selenitireducens (strain ATCC 700615 / DSM 15326 / MLS10) TaxID=439292 RepID=D6Y063_BACIE|nr:RraA family protein [Salisediminibacterium selenitireducens]ADH98454.1 Dimethylmenaquinone methyltransferase [[Bacillus] selenitireducens MLS10]
MTALERQLAELPVTAVSDALKGQTNLDPAIKPVRDHQRVAGRAYTVKVNAADNKLVLKGIGEAREGDVLVVDAKGWMQNAACGDFVAGLAKTLGLSGLVIDGVVRDLDGIRDLDFPVFCKGTAQAASGRHGTGETNIPISCGGAAVMPGDYIVGDIDGVAVIPQGQEEAVFEGARKKMTKDDERERAIIGNEEAARAHIRDVLSKG